jgi:hypothetical protein
MLLRRLPSERELRMIRLASLAIVSCLAACSTSGSPFEFFSFPSGHDGGTLPDGAAPPDGGNIEGFPKCFVDTGAGYSEKLTVDFHAQGFFDNRLPKIGIGLNDDGTGAIVWITAGWLYAARVEAECIQTPVAQRIVFDTSDWAFAVDESGNAFVVWTDSERTNQNTTYEDRLMGSRFDAVSASWSAPSRLSSTRSFPGSRVWITRPDVGASGDQFLVAWYQERGDHPAGAYVVHVAGESIGEDRRIDTLHPRAARAPRVFGFGGGEFVVEHAHEPAQGETLATVFLRHFVNGEFGAQLSFEAEELPSYDFSRPGMVLRAWKAGGGAVTAREYFSDATVGPAIDLRPADAPKNGVVDTFMTASGARFTTGYNDVGSDVAEFAVVTGESEAGLFPYDWHGRHAMLGSGHSSVWLVLLSSGLAGFQRLYADGSHDSLVNLVSYPQDTPTYARQGASGGIYAALDATVSSSGVFHFKAEFVRFYPE